MVNTPLTELRFLQGLLREGWKAIALTTMTLTQINVRR
jgi:hypothetical protein